MIPDSVSSSKEDAGQSGIRRGRGIDKGPTPVKLKTRRQELCAAPADLRLSCMS